MFSQLRPAIVIMLLLTFITGVVYPMAITCVASVLFPSQAGGSVMQIGGKPVGSSLIAQPFSDSKYFWPRPSATGPFPCNPAAASGSNLAPTNPSLAVSVRQRLADLRAADPSNTALVPVELITASASGIDPHLSPEAADYQVPRVAAARRLAQSTVRQAIARHTEYRTFGVLGEARVNVLALNLDLDSRPHE